MSPCRSDARSGNALRTSCIATNNELQRRGRLPSSAVAPVEPYSGADRQALQALERAVLEGTLVHGGDRALGEQVAWTAVDRFDNGDVRRIRKLDRSRPIDASVALAL